MWNHFEFTIVVWILADIVIWGGLYFLALKSHVRDAEKNGKKSNKIWMTIQFVVICLIWHLFWINMGLELKEWGGMD